MLYLFLTTPCPLPPISPVLDTLRHSSEYLPTKYVNLDVQEHSRAATRTQRASSRSETQATPTSGLASYVRPTAAIKNSQILGEYVGDLVPANLDRAEREYRSDISRFVAVDSAAYGNWTRFVNHRCDFNVDSIRTQVGRWQGHHRLQGEQGYRPRRGGADILWETVLQERWCAVLLFCVGQASGEEASV